MNMTKDELLEIVDRHRKWLFDITNDEIRLMAGELTAQEMRTVRAVLRGLSNRVAMRR